MAKNDNLKDFLTDVADAIRGKKGTTNLINPQDFSAEIASIQSGGGAVVVSPKAVNFRDFDGTILHSYTKDEFLALTELPPLPTREGLICQEWNWDFADAVEYVTEYGVLECGATYITDDGKTRLYITIATEGRMDVPLYFYQSVANGVTIDWGDGSATETLSGTGGVNTKHQYNAIGDYVISLEVVDGCILGLGHKTLSYCVMGSTGNNGKVYNNMLKKVEIGKRVITIDKSAFSTCYSLASVMIPQGVTMIDNAAFNNCYSLASVMIPQGVTSIGSSAFYYCRSLASVMIPQGVTSIVNYAFSNCYSLASVMIPQGVTSLGSYIFDVCCSLASVMIPQGVTRIGDYAFSNCYGIAFYDFSALEAVPSLEGTNAFQNIPSDCKIIVPDALYDTWIVATNWSSSNIVSKIIKKSEWDALNA